MNVLSSLDPYISSKSLSDWQVCKTAGVSNHIPQCVGSGYLWGTDFFVISIDSHDRWQIEEKKMTKKSVGGVCYSLS